VRYYKPWLTVSADLREVKISFASSFAVAAFHPVTLAIGVLRRNAVLKSSKQRFGLVHCRNVIALTMSDSILEPNNQNWHLFVSTRRRASWREIEHVSRNAHLSKTLLLLNPKYAEQNAGADVLGKLEHVLGLSVAGVGSETLRIFGLWLDPADGLHVALASRFSRAHCLLILRWFLSLPR
jgi:hypothetical protein